MPAPQTKAEMVEQGYKFSFQRTCRSCHAPVEFWVTPKGKVAPYDPMRTEYAEPVSHFATCPDADNFRGVR